MVRFRPVRGGAFLMRACRKPTWGFPRMKNDAVFRRSRLAQALCLALALPFAASALAQSEQSEEEDREAEREQSSAARTLESITVVGSRIKRTEIEGPAPVTVITREDFEREGFQTVADALQTLTQNTTNSFTGDLAVTGFTPNAQVVNLRNLGPGYTLTLINGRRPAQYPQPYNRDNNVVNIRAIPRSIVERVEILTGGASAIYGSDAIAGVVNIVLREGFEGNNIRLDVGTTAMGGGDSVGLELTGGRTGERWSLLYAFQYDNIDPVFASQRDFLADTRRGPLGAVTNPSLALATLRFNPLNSGITTSVYYPGQDVCDRFGYTTVTTAARGTYCGGFTQPASRSISNKAENVAGYAYGTFDLTPDTRLFAAVNVYDSQAASSSGTEFWSTSGNQFLQTSTGARVNGYYDAGFNAFTFLQRVFNPFELGGEEAATTLYDEFTYDLIFGIQGVMFDRFDWEASAAYSKYEYVADRPRLLSQAMHEYFLGPRLGFQAAPNGVLYPIHQLNLNRWNTPITADLYRNQLATRAKNEADSSSATVNFNMSGELFELPAGAVGFAAVLEAGRQTTDLRSDPRLNPLRPLDNQTVYNLVSSGRTKGERDRYAAGVEFRVPIFSTFTANLAARYDKYDDITEVDDAVTRMLGLEWRPFDSLLLRGSYATSFRAPDMQLVFAEGAASFSGILDQYACRSGTGVGETGGPRTITQCNVAGDPTIYTTQTTIAGNPLLEEEKGTSWGYGFVWDIVEGMSVSADYYRIRLEDQALQLSAAFLLSNEANCRLGTYPDGRPFENAPGSSFCQNIFGLVTRQGGVPTGTITRINSAYINAALTDTSGVDTTFDYRWRTDNFGSFRLNLGWSIVLTDKYKQFADDPLIDYRDIVSRNSRSRVRGSLAWNHGDWNASVFGFRVGTNRSAAAVDGTNAVGDSYPRRLKPWMVYNMQVGKRFGSNVAATFTVENVFNNTFRKDASNTGYPFYDPFIGADPLGRRYNLAVSYRF